MTERKCSRNTGRGYPCFSESTKSDSPLSIGLRRAHRPRNTVHTTLGDDNAAQLKRETQRRSRRAGGKFEENETSGASRLASWLSVNPLSSIHSSPHPRERLVPFSPPLMKSSWPARVVILALAPSPFHSPTTSVLHVSTHSLTLASLAPSYTLALARR